MARPTRAHNRVEKPSRTTPSSSKPSNASQQISRKRSRLHASQLVVKIAVIFLFALVPLALPLYWTDRLVPLLQVYIPQQLQKWLSETLKDSRNFPLESLSPEDILRACSTHQYTSQIISLDPLVIYINNFTSILEAEELINIGSPDFASSFISRSRGPNTLVSGRTSSSAPLPIEHPLVACILERARGFMGSMLLPHEPFSIPQLVRYFPGQKYDLHTDFWPQHQVMNDGSGRLFNRAASFFVFLKANCTGGETWFPKVDATYSSADRRATDDNMEDWYGDKVLREETKEENSGVKFRPIVGNAIFWVNLNAKGEGDRRVVHAGLPVEDGEKIGLNIWPRRFFGNGNEDEEVEKKGGSWSGKWKE